MPGDAAWAYNRDGEESAMWEYERKMPWEKGERKPFAGSSGMPPPRRRPAAAEGPKPADAQVVGPKTPVPKVAVGSSTASAPSAPPAAKAPPRRAAPAPTARPMKRAAIPPSSFPGAPKGPVVPAAAKPKPGKAKPARKKRKPPSKSPEKAPLSEDTGVLLEASFPEMEAAIKKSEDVEIPPDVEEEAKAGDPLLSDSFGDQWAASDSFRQKRKELTKKYQKKQQKKMEFLGAPSGSSEEEDPLLEGKRGDEWAPSDSGKFTPLRELQGLGAHDEDQFEDEEGEGLGTRVLAREADDMERDAVDEEFFSDIDISNEDYAEASKAATEEEIPVARVVRKLDETQFLDYQALVDSGIFRDTDFSGLDEDVVAEALQEEEPDEEGLLKAQKLDEVEFAWALARVPSRWLQRHVEVLVGEAPLPAEPLSKEEFEALFRKQP